MAGGEEHPALQPVAHLVHLVLDGDDLAGEARVVVEQGRVGEAHGDLREVLHLDQDVHRPLDLGELARRPARARERPRRRRSGELPDLGDALGRALQEEHVAGPQHVLGLGVEVPLVVGADGDGAHPRLHGRSTSPRGAAVERALRLDADAGRGSPRPRGCPAGARAGCRGASPRSWRCRWRRCRSSRCPGRPGGCRPSARRRPGCGRRGWPGCACRRRGRSGVLPGGIPPRRCPPSCRRGRRRRGPPSAPRCSSPRRASPSGCVVASRASPTPPIRRRSTQL